MARKTESDFDVPSPMGLSDALELTLELAQRQATRKRRRPTMRETEWLTIQAALEQFDHLLMEHWETLDALPRRRQGGTGSRVRAIWRLADGLRVEQRPSEALLLASRLAEDELREHPQTDSSARDAVNWALYFVERHGQALDECFAG